MSIFPLIILYLIAEIYVLNQVWSAYGFMNMAFAVFAMIVLGTGIIRNQGRYMLSKVQEAAARGETPSDQLLHGMMIFFGGLLFIFPGFISDVIGLLLILPGCRHLFVSWFKRRMGKQMSAGQFRVFTFGSFGGAGRSGGGFSGGFSTGFERPTTHQTMRDVSPLSLDTFETKGATKDVTKDTLTNPTDGSGGEIIDVTPIKRDPQD